MENINFERLCKEQHQLAEEVDYLAGEVKLLAINLAISLAKLHKHHKTIKDLEPQFTELIRRANTTSQQVSDVTKAFQNRKQMIFSLPASSEIIEKRGAYDKIEATLNYVYELSQEVIQTITILKRQKRAG